MTIYIAMVMHKFGATGFAASNRDDLNTRIATWCIDSDENNTCGALGGDSTDLEVIESYFERHPEELLFVDEDEVSMKEIS